MKILLMFMLLGVFIACDKQPDTDGGSSAGRCIDAETARAEGYGEYLDALDPKHRECAPTTNNPTKCFCISDKKCHTASKCK